MGASSSKKDDIFPATLNTNDSTTNYTNTNTPTPNVSSPTNIISNIHSTTPKNDSNISTAYENPFILDLEKVPESSFMDIALRGTLDLFYVFGATCTHFHNFTKKPGNEQMIKSRFVSSIVLNLLEQRYPDVGEVFEDETTYHSYKPELRSWTLINYQFPIIDRVYGKDMGIFFCTNEESTYLPYSTKTSPLVFMYKDLNTKPQSAYANRTGIPEDHRFLPFPSELDMHIPQMFLKATIGSREDCIVLCKEFADLHMITPITPRGRMYPILVFEVTPSTTEDGKIPDLSVCLLAPGPSIPSVTYPIRYKLNFFKNDYGNYKLMEKTALSEGDVIELRKKPCPFTRSDMTEWIEK